MEATKKRISMIELLATPYFEFFPGDFIAFGIAGAIFWFKQQKEDEDF